MPYQSVPNTRLRDYIHIYVCIDTYVYIYMYTHERVQCSLDGTPTRTRALCSHRAICLANISPPSIPCFCEGNKANQPFLPLTRANERVSTYEDNLRGHPPPPRTFLPSVSRSKPVLTRPVRGIVEYFPFENRRRCYFSTERTFPAELHDRVATHTVHHASPTASC